MFGICLNHILCHRHEKCLCFFILFADLLLSQNWHFLAVHNHTLVEFMP
jgi:hypothetical protein